MIPKIIHYCWLSNDPFPASIQKCIDSWKKFLPDYELMLWNFERFPKGTSKWVDQAFDSHKYAFAADYIRLYALYNHGGIYLDSDVEVLKSFNNLLHLPYFIGQENTTSGVEAATMGFEPGNELIGTLLQKYEGKDFINEDGTCNDEALPYIIRRCIESRYNYSTIDTPTEFVDDKDRINVLPIDWFSPKHWQTKEVNCTDNTYSIHHFAASWKEGVKEDDAPAMEHNTKKGKSILDKMSHYAHKLNITICKLACKNKLVAALYIPVYHSEKFYITKRMWIMKNDLHAVLRLKRPIRYNDIEFIKPEMSHNNIKQEIDVPIARIKNSTVEIFHSMPKKYELVTRQDIIKEFRKKK